MRMPNSSVKAVTAASAAVRGRPCRQQCAEQQEAQHDHEACVEKVGSLERPGRGQKEQGRQQQRHDAARRGAAAVLCETGEEKCADHARRGDVERQDVVGKRKDQLPRLVGRGMRIRFCRPAARAARRGRGQARRRTKAASAASRAGTGWPMRAAEPKLFEFVTRDQHEEEQQPHQMAEEQRDRADGCQRHGAGRMALAPRNPAGGEQQRDADGGDEVQEAEQQRCVVGDQAGCQRPGRVNAEHRAAIGDRAGDRQQDADARQRCGRPDGRAADAAAAAGRGRCRDWG